MYIEIDLDFFSRQQLLCYLTDTIIDDNLLTFERTPQSAPSRSLLFVVIACACVRSTSITLWLSQLNSTNWGRISKSDADPRAAWPPLLLRASVSVHNPKSRSQEPQRNSYHSNLKTLLQLIVNVIAVRASCLSPSPQPQPHNIPCQSVSVVAAVAAPSPSDYRKNSQLHHVNRCLLPVSTVIRQLAVDEEDHTHRVSYHFSGLFLCWFGLLLVAFRPWSRRAAWFCDVKQSPIFPSYNLLWRARAIFIGLYVGILEID